MSEPRKYRPGGKTPAQLQRARDIDNAIFAATQPLETRIKDLEFRLANANEETSRARVALAAAQERATVAERFVGYLVEILTWATRRK